MKDVFWTCVAPCAHELTADGMAGTRSARDQATSTLAEPAGAHEAPQPAKKLSEGRLPIQQKVVP